MMNKSLKTVFRWFGQLCLLATLVYSGNAPSQTEEGESELVFRRLSNRRRVILKDCPVVERYTRVLVRRGGVFLPRKARRGQARIRRSIRFVACSSDGNGGAVLLGRERRDSTTTVTIPLSLRSFSQNAVSSQCRSIETWPRWLIYKTIGSHHFSSGDPRRWTAGLIGNGAPVDAGSCVDMLDSSGKVVAKFGRFLPDNQYSFRTYTATGCGGSSGKRAPEIASEARSNSGKTDVYIKLGNSCYGPIDPQRCYNSSQC